MCETCADQEHFVRGAVQLRLFLFLLFLVLKVGVGGGGKESKYHYKQAVISPPAKRHLNGILLACP